MQRIVKEITKATVESFPIIFVMVFAILFSKLIRLESNYYSLLIPIPIMLVTSKIKKEFSDAVLITSCSVFFALAATSDIFSIPGLVISSYWLAKKLDFESFANKVVEASKPLE